MAQWAVWCTTLFFAGLLRASAAEYAAAGDPVPALLDVFPPSVAQVPPEQQGTTRFSSRFTPSGSLWAEGLDERWVFLLQMEHRQQPANSFSLRVGKGGQIYSLRGQFGESVPPSWRGPQSARSPWNDEVWQFVAVCTRYNGARASLNRGQLPAAVVERMEKGPYSTTFFIHNSGAYIPPDCQLDAFYCPLLAWQIVPEKRLCRMLNWGLIPQLRTVHRSPLLYYTQVRDVGEGIIELTWVVHNFAQRKGVVFDHLNAPWGGTRISSLPLRFVSLPDGRLVEREKILNHAGVVEVRKTGGWNLSCASEADDAPSLALIYGRDKHREAEQARAAAGNPYCQFAPSVYRDWRAAAPLYQGPWKDWQTRPANSFRNYDVCEVIPRLRIAPQTTIWYRSFLVVGGKQRVVELARRLVDKVDYGLIRFDARTTPLVPVRFGEVCFRLFARPVAGSRPLFLIEHEQTGRRIVTTDLYYFVEKEPLRLEFPRKHPHYDYYSRCWGYSLDKHHSKWRGLLGFGSEEKPAAGNWQRLSTLLDRSAFPEPDQFHLDLWVAEGRSTR